MSVITETLYAGNQLTIVADASSSGTLERLSDVPSGASQGTETISVSTTTVKGPFAVPTRWRITSTTGALTYSQAVDTRLDATETGYIDGVTAGTATASKAVVLGASKDISTITSATVTTLTSTTVNATNIDAGASGTAGSVDVFPATASKGKLTLACADQTGNTTVTMQVDAMGQATAVHVPDPGAAASYVAQSTAALSLAEVDVLQDVAAGTVTASKAVVVGASKQLSELGVVQFGNGSGGTTVALLHGSGLSSDPTTTATADKNFLGYWVESTAATGDCRGMYLRTYFGGAGSGEALRAYATVSFAGAAAVGGTINGAHVSLSINGGSTISGQASAARFTLDYAAATRTTDANVSCLLLCSNIATGNTVHANNAFIRVVDDGAVALKKLFRLPTVASAGLLAAHTTDAITHSIRCVDEAGTVFYIMATTTSSNRTGGA